MPVVSQKSNGDQLVQMGRVMILRPRALTRACFDSDEWIPQGYEVANRPVKRHPEWGDGVWWSDDFGVCAPIVAAIGGPLGHEQG